MQDTSKYKTSPEPLLWKDETTDEMKILKVVILMGYEKKDSVFIAVARLLLGNGVV
jgi:hypothetical protein